MSNRISAASLNGVPEPKTRRVRSAREALARSKRTSRTSNILRWTATAGPAGLAVLLLGVSMPHLAAGFQHTTHCGVVAGWLLAVAIDASQVIAKLQLTVSAHDGQGKLGRYDSVALASLGIVVSTCLLSVGMNVLAFVSGADTMVGRSLGAIVGILLPLLILTLSYTASCFVLRR